MNFLLKISLSTFVKVISAVMRVASAILSILSFTSGSLAHDRVIVGVLTAEISKVIDILYQYENYESFLPASYVKWVEQGGARVVPLFIGRDQNYYRKMLSKINGVLLPGGGLEKEKLFGYSDAADIILSTAIEMNQNGDYFPVFGIGTGMEMMLYHTNGRVDIMEPCSIGTTSMSLTLSKRDSRMTALYNSSSDHIRILMTSHPIASLNTQRCLPKDSFERSQLSSAWIPFSFNSDTEGKAFVTSVEHRKLPFYGVAFHPEKPAFEWAEKINVPHTLATVEVSQYFANYFVNECRKNQHWFTSSEEENAMLINNYLIQFTGKRGSKFIQSYVFTRDEMMHQT